MSVAGKKVLVTGADGFIGSHLAEVLTAGGADVRAMVMYNAFGRCGWLDEVPPEVKAKLEIVAADIRDPHLTKTVLSGVEIVYHLASLIAVPFSYQSPDSYIHTNVNGTLNVLQAARENRVSHVVHASTSEVYGSAQYVPIDEKHPVVAQSPYAATKIAADQLAISFYCSYGLPVTVIRPFNTYGPRQSARAIVPTIVTQMLAGQGTVRLGSLTPRRDFTYVSDIVEGFLAAGGQTPTVGEVIQLGSGTEISIGDLVNKIAGLMGKEVAVERDARRVRPSSSEVDRLLCDPGEASRLLGWKPRLSLEDGLRLTIDWFTENWNRPGYEPDRYAI
jgi:NAD dependent epimerase/dehydratase